MLISCSRTSSRFLLSLSALASLSRRCFCRSMVAAWAKIERGRGKLMDQSIAFGMSEFSWPGNKLPAFRHFAFPNLPRS